MTITLHDSFAVHPGLWLNEEIVGPSEITVTALAAHLKVSRQTLSSLLNGRAGLSADMAIRFEHAFNLSADTLCRMQTTFYLAEARADADGLKVKALHLAA